MRLVFAAAGVVRSSRGAALVDLLGPPGRSISQFAARVADADVAQMGAR